MRYMILAVITLRNMLTASSLSVHIIRNHKKGQQARFSRFRKR
jgi:hypothetical protein